MLWYCNAAGKTVSLPSETSIALTLSRICTSFPWRKKDVRRFLKQNPQSECVDGAVCVCIKSCVILELLSKCNKI